MRFTRLATGPHTSVYNVGVGKNLALMLGKGIPFTAGPKMKIDMDEVDDSIKAVARTLDALEATGIPPHVLIGVLSGSIAARMRGLSPEAQVLVRQMLVEKFSTVA